MGTPSSGVLEAPIVSIKTDNEAEEQLGFETLAMLSLSADPTVARLARQGMRLQVEIERLHRSLEAAGARAMAEAERARRAEDRVQVLRAGG